MNHSQLVMKARFPKDYFTTEMLSLSNIPCICKIADGRFLIEFSEPLINVEGEVFDFDISEIDKRAPASGGGKYVHYSFAMVTLRPLEEDAFLIYDLTLFKRVSPGWFPVVKGGCWEKPRGEGLIEERSDTALTGKVRQSKKRKRLFDLLGKAESEE